MIWNIEDFRNGLCAVGDVGKQRPEPVAPEPKAEPDLSDASLNDRLKRDGIKAYVELGGVEFLKKNQDMLGKVLAKALLPDKPTEPEVAEAEYPPWVKAQRLAYQVSSQVAADIGGPGWSNDPAVVRDFLRAYPQVYDFADEFLRRAEPRALANAPSAAPAELVPEVAPEPVAPPTPPKPVKGVRDLLPKDLTQIVRLSDLKR